MTQNYELWRDLDGSYTLFPTGSSVQKLLEPGAEQILVFEADNWEQACQRQNDLLSWGAYQPMPRESILAS